MLYIEPVGSIIQAVIANMMIIGFFYVINSIFNRPERILKILYGNWRGKKIISFGLKMTFVYVDKKMKIIVQINFSICILLHYYVHLILIKIKFSREISFNTAKEWWFTSLFIQ